LTPHEEAGAYHENNCHEKNRFFHNFTPSSSILFYIS
jgi:hypothetical protein